jgi:lactate permease
MLDTLLALLPFLFITYFLVLRDAKASHVLLGAYTLTVIVMLLVWGQPASLVVGATAKGLLIALEVMLIIAGVLLIFALLERTGRLQHLERFFSQMTDEKQVHVIIIGFFLVSFLEGIAGFGTPAAIAAPLLVLVGLRPLTAVVVALVANSAAVVFGAFGTPIVVGVSGGALGADLHVVAQQAALLMALPIALMPLAILWLYARMQGQAISTIRPFARLALVAGALTAACFVLVTFLFGPETPSVLAPLLGGALTFALSKAGLLGVRIRSPKFKEALPALSPYGLAVALLLLSRADVLGFGSFLRSVGAELSLAGGAVHYLSFYTPGALLLLSFIAALFVFRIPSAVCKATLRDAFQKARPVMLTLAVTIAFAQLVIHSQGPNIPSLLAGLFAGAGPLYLFFSPLIGAFGSFIAGSATVSNLMFSAIQADAAVLNGLSAPLVLALQAVGAAAGNMVAIHNILAVLAVVNLRTGVGRIVRANLKPVLLFCALASLSAFLLL